MLAGTGQEVTLQSYLAAHPEVEQFFAHDEFWEKMQVTAQIPLERLVALDPTVEIVGKDEEIETLRTINFTSAQIQEARVERFSDLRMQAFEIDHIKRRLGLAQRVTQLEAELRKQGITDFEDQNAEIIRQLTLEGRYQPKKARDFIHDNLERTIVNANVDYEQIARKMMSEFETPQIVTLEGPLGAGKSRLQDVLMTEYEALLQHHSIPGFELISVKDPQDKARGKLIKVIEGEGKLIQAYYDAKDKRKETWKKWGKRAGIAAVGIPLVYFLMNASDSEVTGRWGWSADRFKIVGQKIFANIDSILGAVGVGTLATIAGIYAKSTIFKYGDRPHTVSVSRVESYGGAISRQNLFGSLESENDSPPQNRIIGGSFSNSDGKGVIVEQLSEIDHDNQAELAEIWQTLKIKAGGQAFTTDYFGLAYVGINPHTKTRIIKPLLDRLNLGPTCFVRNDFERTTEIERRFALFLESHRKHTEASSGAYHKDAVQEALYISSVFAEDANRLEISRRFINVINRAQQVAQREGSPYVSEAHMAEARKTAKSSVEQTLADRLKQYYARIPQNDWKAGDVHVLSYLTDPHLVDHNVEDPAIVRELAQRDGLGYIVRIRTTKTEGENGTTIIFNNDWDDVTQKAYEKSFNELLKQRGHTKGEYHLTVDISDALAPDEALISGMVMSAESCIHDQALDERNLYALPSNVSGRVQEASKLNKRIFSFSNHLPEQPKAPYTVVAYYKDNLAVEPSRHNDAFTIQQQKELPTLNKAA